MKGETWRIIRDGSLVIVGSEVSRRLQQSAGEWFSASPFWRRLSSAHNPKLSARQHLYGVDFTHTHTHVYLSL